MKPKLKLTVERGVISAQKEFDRRCFHARAIARARKSSADFKCAAGAFRVWPNGAVSRIDEDGDSSETIFHGLPTAIVVVASAPLYNALRLRLNSGLFGKNVHEVAERLLCEAVRPPVL